MIDIQNLRVEYDSNRAAVADLSLQVQSGEFVFVIGPTGAGKSTLLKVLYRAEQVTSGSVKVDGVDVGAMDPRKVPELRRKMGVVFQDYELLPTRTVFENVAFALRVLGIGRREVRRRVPAVLEMVGMMRRCDAYPSQLSGGEQQRVAIARALVNDPPILLADEPTGNLDPDTSLVIAQILDAANKRGTTVMVATHDKLIVDELRRRVVEMAYGRKVRDEADGVYLPSGECAMAGVHEPL